MRKRGGEVSYSTLLDERDGGFVKDELRSTMMTYLLY
jgi:hypothetical protein